MNHQNWKLLQFLQYQMAILDSAPHIGLSLNKQCNPRAGTGSTMVA